MPSSSGQFVSGLQQLSLNTKGLIEFPEHVLEAISDAGYKTLELNLGSALSHVKDLKMWMKSSMVTRCKQLSISSASLPIFDLATGNTERIKILKHSLSILDEIEVRKASVIIEGLPIASFDSLSHKKALTIVKRILEETSSRNIELSLENSAKKTEIFASIDTLVSVISGLRDKNLGIAVDVGHAFVTGQEPHKVLAESLSFTKSVHLSDNDGVSDLHKSIGQGKIDYFRIFDTFRKTEFDGSIFLEVDLSHLRNDCKTMKDVLLRNQFYWQAYRLGTLDIPA